MTQEAARKALQQMHTTRTVSNKAVIAWHVLAADQVQPARPDFPPLNPSVSPVDLLLAAGLWMELTEQGQTDPPFPADYRSALILPDPEGPQPRTRMAPAAIGALSIMWLGMGSFYACYAFGASDAFPVWSPWVLGFLSVVVIYRAPFLSGTIVPIQAIRPGAPFHTLAKKATDWSQRR